MTLHLEGNLVVIEGVVCVSYHIFTLEYSSKDQYGSTAFKKLVKLMTTSERILHIIRVAESVIGDVNSGQCCQSVAEISMFPDFPPKSKTLPVKLSNNFLEVPPKTIVDIIVRGWQ